MAAVVRVHRSRVTLAVASGGTRAAVEPTLESVGLLELFDAVVTYDDVELGKPAPDLFLLAAERLLSRHPDGCIVYEDTDEGVMAARNAGMRVIDVRAVLNSGHNRHTYSTATHQRSTRFVLGSRTKRNGAPNPISTFRNNAGLYGNVLYLYLHISGVRGHLCGQRRSMRRATRKEGYRGVLLDNPEVEIAYRHLPKRFGTAPGDLWFVSPTQKAGRRMLCERRYDSRPRRNVVMISWDSLAGFCFGASRPLSRVLRGGAVCFRFAGAKRRFCREFNGYGGEGGGNDGLLVRSGGSRTEASIRCASIRPRSIRGRRA